MTASGVPSGVKSTNNKYGKLEDLKNEATVEQFFINRLLTDLGYDDQEIRPKSTLDELTISQGRRKVLYRPDYAIKVQGKVRWICEAKGVNENLEAWVGQCRSYCLELNKNYKENPVQFFLLTNGVESRLYRWDQAEPMLVINFHHFVDGSERFHRLCEMLSRKAVVQASQLKPTKTSDRLILRRKTVSELNLDFAWAHRLIYKRENLSYTAAFMEFVKLIFLKLLSDRVVHESKNLIKNADSASIPIEEVGFSRYWIEQRERDTPNPLDAIRFYQLLRDFETEIREGSKKRIFDSNEHLNLSADTIKALVERFEGIDLISIDADLNGRMFETFLNSTLRGKALGQYFTPRSVVKLAIGLAQLRATPTHVDRVVDACCGTGGFLIEALAAMWQAIDANKALSNTDKEALRSRVATQSLVGIDVARDPALARIARINMYLHGDGGSSIYQLDALDKEVREIDSDGPEIRWEKTEFRNRLTESTKVGGFADVVLTNPPFAKDYSRNSKVENMLLDDYELAFDYGSKSRRPIKTVSSMVLFLERYHDLLRVGGRLITIIDDGLLGSSKYRGLRDWIRKRWIIKAVVSLPGDAFQRSQARVKTSLIVLEKRVDEKQQQPAVFMYYCTAVGIDDAPRQRVLPIDEENRRRAQEEIELVGHLFKAFEEGKPEANNWVIEPEALVDRLDVKACLPQAARRVNDWRKLNLEVVTLADLIAPVDLLAEYAERVIDASETDELVTYLRVRYDGFTESGDEVWTSDVGSARLVRVKEGDIVFSHINAVHGAVGVVPPEHNDHVVTSEFTVCRPFPGIHQSVVWELVRSPEARADLLLLATGIGRTRIRWSEAQRLQLPKPSTSLAKEVVAKLSEADKALRKADELRAETRKMVETDLALDSPTARDIIAAFKPPR